MADGNVNFADLGFEPFKDLGFETLPAEATGVSPDIGKQQKKQARELRDVQAGIDVLAGIDATTPQGQVELTRIIEDETFPEETRFKAEDALREGTQGKFIRAREETLPSGRQRIIGEAPSALRQVSESLLGKEETTGLVRGQSLIPNTIFGILNTFDAPSRALGALVGKGKVSDPETTLFKDEIADIKRILDTTEFQGQQVSREEEIRIYENLKAQAKTPEQIKLFDEIIAELEGSVGERIGRGVGEFLSEFVLRSAGDPTIVAGGLKNLIEGIAKKNPGVEALQLAPKLGAAVAEKAKGFKGAAEDFFFFRPEKGATLEVTRDLVRNKKQHLQNFKNIKAGPEAANFKGAFLSDISSKIVTKRGQKFDDIKFPEATKLDEMLEGAGDTSGKNILNEFLDSQGVLADTKGQDRLAELIFKANQSLTTEDLLKVFKSSDVDISGRQIGPILNSLNKKDVSATEVKSAIRKIDDFLAAKKGFGKDFVSGSVQVMKDLRQQLNSTLEDMAGNTFTSERFNEFLSLKQTVERKTARVKDLLREQFGLVKTRGLDAPELENVNQKINNFLKQITSAENLKADDISEVIPFRKIQELDKELGTNFAGPLKSAWLIQKFDLDKGAKTLKDISGKLPGTRLLPARKLIQGSGILSTIFSTAANTPGWLKSLVVETVNRKNLRKTEFLFRTSTNPVEILLRGLTNKTFKLDVQALQAMTLDERKELRILAQQEGQTQVVDALDDLTRRAENEFRSLSETFEKGKQKFQNIVGGVEKISEIGGAFGASQDTTR